MKTEQKFEFPAADTVLSALVVAGLAVVGGVMVVTQAVQIVA